MSFYDWENEADPTQPVDAPHSPTGPPVKVTLPFEDRVLLAQTNLLILFEQQGMYLNDNHVLDIAATWTTSTFNTDGTVNETDRSDYNAIEASLFAHLDGDA